MTTRKLVLTVLGHFWWPGSNNDNNYWTEKHNAKKQCKSQSLCLPKQPCISMFGFAPIQRTIQELQRHPIQQENLKNIWQYYIESGKKNMSYDKKRKCDVTFVTCIYQTFWLCYREGHINLYVHSFLLMQGWRNHWSCLHLVINLTYN